MKHVPSNPAIAKHRKTRRYQRARTNILIRDGGICWLCGRPGANTADHIIPLAQGGHPYSELNLRAAHHSCNSRRGANTPTPTQTNNSRQW